MTPSSRVFKRLLTAITAVGLFLLLTANPFAQTNKLPAPSGQVSDFAGVLDSQTKNRLESLLQKLKEKSNIELYVATVDSTGAQEIAAFSGQLARDWNIGSKTARSKTMLLVVSAASKTSFTQISRAAQAAMPEGVLGEMSYRMSGPLGDGRFAEAIDSGVHVFANALAEKIGFKVSELESSPVASNASEPAAESPQPVLVSAGNVQRPRVVSDIPKATPEATPPADAPKSDPAPIETPASEPTPSESPKSEAIVVESPKVEVKPAETPNKETLNADRRKPAANSRAGGSVTKRTPAQTAEQDADELEQVDLTLTLPLAQRAVKLKEFLDTHPDSKSRLHATELLISTHASLGDQKLKNGDSVGGVEQLLRAIDEADVSISDQLFSGVISQIPMNLYLRGEREAAFRAAQNVETRFGTDAKRLLAVAGFYLGIERSAETVRLAESAVKLAPDLAEAHRILAVGLHISLRLDEAAAEYKRALELDPASKVSRCSLADLYRASGKTEEALALYNEQLAADPKDKAARAGKVISLFELSRNDEANSVLAAALAEEPRNLPLLTGASYWLAAHNNNEKALELARKAVAIEPRYTWAQIALGRSLLGLGRPLDAERAMRYARQFGKFPTLSYELANVLSSMGLYDEAAEVLRESFTIKDEQIQAYLAGTLLVSENGFLELLAPERRAGIYQPTAADSVANAKTMKALLAFNVAVTPQTEGEKVNETAAVAAAKEFARGTDSMRAFRQLYAASRLLRSGVGVETALDLVAQARAASDEAVKVPVLTMAVQADEFRELRARAIAAGSVPDVASAPPDVLAKILKGRVEDLQGWALFNQEKYTQAVTHLKLAAEILPAQTPAWRTALWHLGVTLEQSGQKELALDTYIKSYRGGPVETVRRSVIEQLYRSVKGSLEGLEQQIGPGAVSNNLPATEPTKSESQPVAKPEPEPVAKPESPPVATPETPIPTAPNRTSETTQPMSEEALKNLGSRLKSNIKITGRILDANKTGIGNVVVVLISPSGAVLASTTDNEGNYSFTIAPSSKQYRVIPSKDGYTFAPLDKVFTGLYEDQREIDFVGARP
jgi:tetratricopeptide (TPR) repeat protein/uncharacterized membrane protein YgcG